MAVSMTGRRRAAMAAWKQANADLEDARRGTRPLSDVAGRRAAALQAMRAAGMSWREVTRETGVHRDQLEQIVRTAKLYSIAD